MSGQCMHRWKIFKDMDLVKTGFLSFYCDKCLALRKIKKEYKDDNI